MKKQYTKPDILFEDFALSTSIAAGCDVKIDTQAERHCGMLSGGTFVFIEGVSGCRKKVVDGSINDGLCYDVPLETNDLFNS